MIYVIVHDGDEEGGEIWARVMQHNVVDFAEEDSYAEAALNQHPDILKAMNKLCRALAECRLDEENRRTMTQIFHAKLAARREEETQAAELLSGTSSGVSRRNSKKTPNTFMLKTVVFLLIVKTSFLCSPLE